MPRLRKSAIICEEGISENEPVDAKFPLKLWNLASTCHSGAISWSSSGKTILIEYDMFQKQFLACKNNPITFKTTSMPSFIRQLNLYGFRKVKIADRDPLCNVRNTNLHEFSNVSFQREMYDSSIQISRKIGKKKTFRRINENQQRKFRIIHGPSKKNRKQEAGSKLNLEENRSRQTTSVLPNDSDIGEFRKQVVKKRLPIVDLARNKLLKTLNDLLEDYKQQYANPRVDVEADALSARYESDRSEDDTVYTELDSTLNEPADRNLIKTSDKPLESVSNSFVNSCPIGRGKGRSKSRLIGTPIDNDNFDFQTVSEIVICSPYDGEEYVLLPSSTIADSSLLPTDTCPQMSWKYENDLKQLLNEFDDFVGCQEEVVTTTGHGGTLYGDSPPTSSDPDFSNLTAGPIFTGRFKPVQNAFFGYMPQLDEPRIDEMSLSAQHSSPFDPPRVTSPRSSLLQSGSYSSMFDHDHEEDLYSFIMDRHSWESPVAKKTKVRASAKRQKVDVSGKR